MGVLNEGLGIAGQEGSFQRSFDLWREFNLGEIYFNPGVGYYLRERFEAAPTYASAVSQHGFTTYQDAGDTCQGIATQLGGALHLLTDATDNDEVHHQAGGLVGAAFKIDGTTPRSLAHEQCVSVDGIVEIAALIGLAEEGTAIADALVDNTGALVDKDFVGFHVPAHASVAKASFVYRKAGQAMVTVEADVHTFVAGVPAMLGCYFEKQSKKLYGYVNGVIACELAHRDWVAAGFPDGEELSPIRGIKSGSGAAKGLKLYWADTAQLR